MNLSRCRCANFANTLTVTRTSQRVREENRVIFPVERQRRRTGLTILELIVSIAIIAMLLALLSPAVAAARESARRIQCLSHLRQMGVGLHHHHDTHNHFPVGWTFDPTQQSAYGWATQLLPSLEQAVLAEQIDLDRPLADPRHDRVRQTTLANFLCPSDISEPTFMLFEEDQDHEQTANAFTPNSQPKPNPLLELPTANYVGVFGTIEPDDEIPAPLGDGTFLENRSTRLRDFSRGLSNTTIVGERTMAQVPSTWLGVSLSGEDAAARLVGSALEGINNPLADECDFSSRHPGGANFLWGDGHISFVSESVDLQEYHRWSQLRAQP